MPPAAAIPVSAANLASSSVPAPMRGKAPASAAPPSRLPHHATTTRRTPCRCATRYRPVETQTSCTTRAGIHRLPIGMIQAPTVQILPYFSGPGACA